MAEMAFQLAGNQVTGDDTSCFAFDHDYVQHLVTVVHGNITEGNLALEGLVSTDQQLLPGLTCGVESTLYLCTTERTVAEQTAIFPCERHTLCYALVDDVG